MSDLKPTKKMIDPNLLKSIKKPKKLNKTKKITKIQVEPTKQKYEINHNKKEKILLIIDFQTNWYKQFKNAALKDGTPIKIYQTRWHLIDLESSNKTIKVELKYNKDLPNPEQKSNNDLIQITPDFLLIRELPTNVHGINFINILIGFMYANLGSVNSLFSIYMTMQRALVYSSLNQLKLPLIDQTYHPNNSSRMQYLLNNNNNKQNNIKKVIKVGNCHAGYGKIRSFNTDDNSDIKSILMLSKDYYTEEKYIDNIDYEYRIQKIGDNISVFKRISSGDWKTHLSSMIALKTEDKHIKWINKASSIYNGLDICALDVLKTKDGNDIILELNDTAIGLFGANEVKHESLIRDIVVHRMSQQFCQD